VPEQAIVPMGEQKNVYTVVQGKAKLVPVDDRHAPAGPGGRSPAAQGRRRSDRRRHPEDRRRRAGRAEAGSAGRPPAGASAHAGGSAP
jgi:hypothetical protein